MLNLTARERQLMRLMREQGYDCLIFETCCRLSQRGIRGFTSIYELPYTFRSVHQAAEHLIPIVKDDTYRLAVLGDE